MVIKNLLNPDFHLRKISGNQLIFSLIQKFISVSELTKDENSTLDKNFHIETKIGKMVQTRNQMNPRRPTINYSGMDYPGRRPRMENQNRSFEIPTWVLPVVFLGGLIAFMIYHFVC